MVGHHFSLMTIKQYCTGEFIAQPCMSKEVFLVIRSTITCQSYYETTSISYFIEACRSKNVQDIFNTPTQFQKSFFLLLLRSPSILRC